MSIVPSSVNNTLPPELLLTVVRFTFSITAGSPFNRSLSKTLITASFSKLSSSSMLSSKAIGMYSMTSTVTSAWSESPPPVEI